jgi:transcriptional regulator with XRE-family HTH domain
METFSDRLTSVIENSGLSRPEFAKRSEVGTSALAKWLAGKLTPKSDQLMRLAKTGGVAMEWLLTGSDAAAVSHTGGRPPIYNPGMSARSSIIKSTDLEREAAELRKMGTRLKGQSESLLAEAAKLSELARFLLVMDDDEEDEG